MYTGLPAGAVPVILSVPPLSSEVRSTWIVTGEAAGAAAGAGAGAAAAGVDGITVREAAGERASWAGSAAHALPLGSAREAASPIARTTRDSFMCLLLRVLAADSGGPRWAE